MPRIRGRLSRPDSTKGEQSIAVSMPVRDDVPPLWGALADVMQSVDGVDLTAPLEEHWDAELGRVPAAGDDRSG